MGCDIHIDIQVREPDGWRSIPYATDGSWRKNWTPPEGVPLAPKNFCNRNYDLFGILADVRNGRGFAGINTGTGWPSIAADRGVPDDVPTDPPPVNPDYPEDNEPRWMGDHSFTWIGLDEIKAFDWDGVSATLTGIVTAAEYEKLSASGKAPESYCGGVSGHGIRVYSPESYVAAKAAGALVEHPHVRMAWSESARSATYDWAGKVIPWLDEIASGRELRLVIGFDS